MSEKQMKECEGSGSSGRMLFVRGYNLVSDLLHCVLGILLLAACAAQIVNAAPQLLELFSAETGMQVTARLVDKVLFVMMILEVGHTVLISYKEHVIRPEPFLVVGIIASIRRILALTILVVEFHMDEKIFRMAMIETGVLSILIIILVTAIILLRKRSNTGVRLNRYDGDAC